MPFLSKILRYKWFYAYDGRRRPASPVLVFFQRCSCGKIHCQRKSVGTVGVFAVQGIESPTMVAGSKGFAQVVEEFWLLHGR